MFLTEEMIVVGVKGEGRGRHCFNDPILSRFNPEGNLVGRVGIHGARGSITR